MATLITETNQYETLPCIIVDAAFGLQSSEAERAVIDKLS